MKVKGLLKCMIWPQNALYNLMFPTRIDDKSLVYYSDCEHSSEESSHHYYVHSSVIVTWTMYELRKAVEKVYVIMDLYEVWKFDMATFENGKIFTDFVNNFFFVIN